MNFFHETRRDVLIYPQWSPVLAQAIPEAREVNGHGLAVPRNLRNSQILRYLNYPVPPIITDQNYSWPHAPGIKPYESQKLTANFLVLNRRCFVLSDLGCGKSLAALWAADYLMRQSDKPLRALIVAPLSTLQRVWADAIFKHFLSHRTFEILHGDAAHRSKALSREADFYLVNHDGVGVGAHTQRRIELGGFSKQLAERDDIGICIVDEASAYKDSQTRRHRIARLVFGEKPYLFLMTGTPTPNAPTDAYGLAKLVNNAWGKSRRTFQQETMIQVSTHIWKPQRDGYDKARKLLSPSIRVDIKEVWDAPPMTVQQREVALTEEQKRLMAQLKRELQVVVKSGQVVSAANEAAARTKWIQISLGAVYDAHHHAHPIDASPRFNEMEKIVEEANRKILIFLPLTSVVRLAMKHLSKRWKGIVINGEVPAKERAVLLKQFADDDEVRFAVCDPGAIAFGVNEFVAADTVLWAGITDKSELYIQGNGRVLRPGQKFPVTIIQLVSNPLEREVFKRLENRESLQGTMLDMVRKGEL